jgi:hypothetical protein
MVAAPVRDCLPSWCQAEPIKMACRSGIQVVGRAFGEETVLAMARALEREFVRIWFAVLIA